MSDVTLTLNLQDDMDLEKTLDLDFAVSPHESVVPGIDVGVFVCTERVATATLNTIEHVNGGRYLLTLKNLDTSMTPEGKIKKRLKQLLEPYGKDVYQFWPMQNGMGAPALDVILCYNGYFISIELKAGKKRMTERQEHTANSIRDAGGETLLMNEHEGWLELQSWLGEKSR